MRPFSVKVRPLATRPAGARPAPQTATTLWLVFVTAQATAGRSAATVHALQPAGPGTGSTALQRSMEPAIGATTDSETCRLVERREDIAVKVARRRRDEVALAFAQLAQVTRPRPSWDKVIVRVLTRILLNVGPLAIVVGPYLYFVLSTGPGGCPGNAVRGEALYTFGLAFSIIAFVMPVLFTVTILWPAWSGCLRPGQSVLLVLSGSLLQAIPSLVLGIWGAIVAYPYHDSAAYAVVSKCAEPTKSYGEVLLWLSLIGSAFAVAQCCLGLVTLFTTTSLDAIDEAVMAGSTTKRHA